MGEIATWVLIPLTLLVFYLCHKIRRIHLQTYEILTTIDLRCDNTYRQLQSFLAIENSLHLARFLPPLQGWAASPDFLLIVMNHALDQKPHVIVECGSGASTLILARCAQMNACGQVYSLEHELAIANKTRGLLKTAGLDNWATVIYAPIVNHTIDGKIHQWYSLTDLPQSNIDLLVVDGPPMPLGSMIRYPAGPLLLPRLKERGAVFLDDMKRCDEQVAFKRWISEYGHFSVEDLGCERGCIALHASGREPSETQ
jgi:hypothetical protein